MSRPRRRARRLAATAACTLAAWAVSSAWSGAAADPPAKYGWWSATNAGAAVPPPPPPDVPANGLYAENGFSGPTALAAVSFAVPDRATVGALTLKTAGSPVISAAPVACVVTAAGRAYRPAENGAWAAKPAYDCRAGRATGAVSSDGTEVTFPVAPLVRAGALDVVVLATGRTDRIPLQAPGADALAVTSPAGPVSSGAAPAAPGGAYAGQSSTPSTARTSRSRGLPAGLLPPAVGGAGTANPPPDTALSPTVAPPSARAGLPSVTAADASTRDGSGARTTVATGFGLAAMVVALVFWTEGFGLLGGRVRTLAGRRRGRAGADRPPPAASTGAPSVTAPPSAAARS